MIKRIMAALLTLVLLLMMIPVMPANAEDSTENPEKKTYKLDDTAMVTGYIDPEVGLDLEKYPLADPERTKWEPTGYSEKPDKCPIPEHLHDEGCRDDDWNLICGYDEEHEHTPWCVIDMVLYEWKVVLKVTMHPTVKQFPLFTVNSRGESVDSAGNPVTVPLAGCGYKLFFETLKRDENGELVVKDGKYVLQSFGLHEDVTDANGLVTLGFDDVKELEDLDPYTDEKSIRLTLGQVLNVEAQPMTDQEEEKPLTLDYLYHPKLYRWYITVVWDDDGNYSIQSVTHAPAASFAPPAKEDSEEGGEEAEPTEGTEPTQDPENLFVDEYSVETKTLKVVNERLSGTIKVDVIFDGFSGAVPPEVMATVTIPEIKDSENRSHDFTVNENGFYLVQHDWEKLALGTYTLEVTNPVPVEGYEAKAPVIERYCPVDAPTSDAESNVTLSKDRLGAKFVITYRYVKVVEEPTAPTGDGTESTGPTGPTEGQEATTPATPHTSNTILVRVLDDLENPLPGTELSLYDGKDQLCKWRETYENVFVLDDLEKYAKEGESVTYTLRQSRAPAGYRLSGDTFTIKISNRNGKTEVDVKRNGVTVGNLFKGNGIEIGSDGKQVVTLHNTRKTAQLQVGCHVAVDFGEESWIDEKLAEEYKQRQYEFTLNWENAEGEKQVETLLLSDGEETLFKAEIPYNTRYEVTITDTDGSFVTEYSENHTGQITTDHLKENALIEATMRYTVERGETAVLDLVKVDAEDKRPMAGVGFSLKDEDGTELMAYITGENGELIIRDVFTKPGIYTLEETSTLEGYVLLEEPAVITVGSEYVLDTSSGKPVMMQNLTAEITHSAMVAESDGSYWIENERIPVIEEPEEPDGLPLGLIIGLAIGAAAIAASAVAIVLIRRKRKLG